MLCELSVNVIAASNTSSYDRYQRRCREEGVKRHPARFPKALPEFIIGLCTEEGDLVLDPFAGSNTTGEVAQEMDRLWLAFEMEESYLEGSRFRSRSWTRTRERLLERNRRPRRKRLRRRRVSSRTRRPPLGDNSSAEGLRASLRSLFIVCLPP